MGFKKLLINKIHNNTTYKLAELADVLYVCPATIWNYVQRGMPVISKESRCWYFDGKAVKKYLIKFKQTQRTTMQFYELYCFKCRKPRVVEADSIKLFHIGYFDKNQFMRSIKITGECKKCGTMISRFSTDDLLYDFLDYYMIKNIEVIELKNQIEACSKGIYDLKERDSE